MKALIVILLFFVSINLFAQSPFGVSKEHLEKKLFYVELMGGTVLPDIKFSGTSFSDAKSSRYFDKTGGVSFRFENKRFFSITAQLSYCGLGGYFPDNDDFKLKANYLNLFIPVELGCRMFSKKKKNGPCMILFAGPYGAKQIGGHISSNTLDIELTDNDISNWDYGAEGGIGLRIPTYSLNGHSNLTLKASYYRGFANTFPETIDYDSEQMTERMLSETGERYQCGFKLSLSYGFSLEKRQVSTFTAGGDGKKTYKKFLVQ